MKKTHRLAIAGVLLCMLGPLSAAGQSKWFTTYYSTWSMMPLGSSEIGLPPWEIDWTGLTHVVLFDNGNVTQTAPYWAYMFGPPPARPSDTESDSLCVEFNGVAAPGSGVFPHYMDSLVAIAHRKGVKVVITIQAVNPLNLNYVAADSARAELFINTVAAWAERKKFDGVELDWEGWAVPLPPPSTVNRFVRMLYRRIHTMKTVDGAPGLIMISAGSGQEDLYDPAQDAMVDQFNLQLYDYIYAWYGKIGSNASWHIAPLHKGTVDPTFEGQAYDTRGPLQWVAAGHEARRIGLGIPIFGYILRNVDGLFQRMGSDGDYCSAHYQVIEALKEIGGVEEWDDARKVRSIHGTAVRGNGRSVYYKSDGVAAGQKFFATGENPRSLQEKVNWMNANNFGGVMTYEFVSDLDWRQSLVSGRRHPLHRSIATALGAPPPPENLPTTHTLSLPAGWNIISSYVRPDVPLLDLISGPLLASKCVIKNGEGHVYWPDYSIRAITSWNPLHGYLVYTEAPQSLTFSGALIDPAKTPIRLARGMNLVPYLRTSPLPPEIAFASVKDSLIIVSDGAGRLFWPAKKIQTLQSVVPGAGYLVYVSAPAEFTYPANTAPAPVLGAAASGASRLMNN